MFFSDSRQRKVDLRGRSRGEESREQVLEKARAEREKRQRLKHEQRAATRISSFWRGRRAAAATAQQFRSEWQALYGAAAAAAADRCVCG